MPIPRIFEAILPLQNEFYSQEQLTHAYQCLNGYFQLRNLGIVPELTPETRQHLNVVRALLAVQNALPRAAIAARRIDYLASVLGFVDNLLNRGAINIARADQEHNGDAWGLIWGYTNKIIKNPNYINYNIYKIAAIRVQEEELGDQRLADLLAAAQAAAQVRPRVQTRAQTKRTKVNTHTATVHQDASNSALRLKQNFSLTLFNSKMLDIEWIFSKEEGNNFLKELLRIVGEDLEENEQAPNTNKLKNSIKSAISNILNSTFKDPTSGIMLHEIFKILLVAINSLENKNDAYLQLCKALYLLQEEYTYVGDGNQNNASCEPGIFNGIIYSQSTTLPVYIKIRIHAKSHATLALGDKMQHFALGLLKENDCQNAKEFEALAIFKMKEELPKIMHEVIVDHYSIFGYDCEENAVRDLAKLNQHCQMLCGCIIDDLPNVLPIDFEAMFDQQQRQKQTLVTKLKPS